MKSRDGFSRKELSGWGDIGEKYSQHINLDTLSNTISSAIEPIHEEQLKKIVGVVLQGLHMDDHIIVGRKYDKNKEDSIFVTQYLKNILYKRALKKLSSIIN